MTPFSIESTAGMTPGSSASSGATTPQQRLERALSHLVQPPDAVDTEQGLAQDPSQGASPGALQGELVEPLQRINAVMRSYGLEFDLQSYDSRVVTRVVDRESGEVIRQIPSEEVLRIADSLARMQGRLIELQA